MLYMRSSQEDPMKRNEKITKIMTSNLTTAHLQQPLSEVRATMAEGGFHHMLVVNGKKLIGLISSTDLLRVSYQYGQDVRQTDAILDDTVDVGSLMSRDLITLSEGNTVRDAVDIFSQGQLHSLPVVDSDGNLVGLATTTDVLRYMKEQY
ncbi:MAG: CBS domain-containing protein [Myxococcota bacterium]|jgi:CBS domain-containing protein